MLYEQVCRRDIQVYEEFFAWQLVVNDDRCQGVICWDLLNGGLEDDRREDRHRRNRRGGPALRRHDERVRVHR